MLKRLLLASVFAAACTPAFSAATLDPGTSDAPAALFATAIDGTPLRPVTLWIEGTIGELIIERCITGALLLPTLGPNDANSGGFRI